MLPTDAIRFLKAIFRPGDMICIRPLESWTEEGKKRSLVDREGIKYILNGMRGADGAWQAADAILARNMQQAHTRHLRNHTNLFFGVCPRLGGDGRFDQAWQIRVVRVLWMDIDDCKPDEALLRCEQNKIPKPSVVVSSGNGTHLYWILAEPYLIDDCPAPQSVRFDWVEKDGRRRRRPYILDEDRISKLYLDLKSNVPKLSAKAQHFQDILSGIAGLIGGDHTQDLSRLLRIPGSMNHKDHRTGKPPTECSLVELNDLRYAASAFEPFLENSPARIKRQKISQIPLPVPRRVNHKMWDALDRYISTSATADAGDRSEADFSLCCFAVERGIPRGEAWGRVSGVGKFAERGESYFDRTWAAAEQHTREKVFDHAERTRQAHRAAAAQPSANGHASPTHGAPRSSPAPDPLSEDRRICAEMQIDVLGETPDGSIKIFSEYFGKTVVLNRVVFQTVVDLLQKIGPVAREKVYTGKEDLPPPGLFTLQRIQQAIAVVGGAESAGVGAELGQGVWRTKNDHLVLVNPKRAAVWNGNELREVRQPRIEELKIDMDLPEEWKWFDHGKLAAYLVRAKETAWAEGVLAETAAIFRKWNWKQTMDAAADLVVGLILCTFVESCWTWRPLVALTAESDSGKSLFFETLATIFGPLALLNAKSTEAGIRQAVGQHAKAILCDEFESDLHRDKILEFFRTASRGSQTLRGTSNQQAQRYGLRHIPWCAAVGIKLDRAPDRNRFIFLEFSPPPKEKRGKIDLPQEPVLADLGQKLLAIALFNVCKADLLAARLKSLQIEGTHGRVVESFATPVAMLATAIGLGWDESQNLLHNVVGKAEQDPAQATKDQTELLGDILSSEVYLEHGSRATVSQILKNPDGYTGGWDALERTGITLVGNGRWAKPLEIESDRKSLFVGTRQVSRYLLKGTRWAEEPVEQILLRLPGAIRNQHQVGGHRPRGVDVPWELLRDKYMQEDAPDEPATGRSDF